MTMKALLLFLLAVPLLWMTAVRSGDADAKIAAATTQDANQDAIEETIEEATETPFVLLATVHNYGYIEPCG
ncbi:MAG: hypothetical protein VX949_09035 [Planctomycetota bacterium]|nr:hypothetical protein [Planctomycetota bacterium]